MLVSGRVITVDGRIRRSPVEVGSLSHDLQGFYIPGGAGFQPSTVSLITFRQSNMVMGATK